MAPPLPQRTVLPSIPRPLGPAIRRRLQLQEPPGKLPILVASRSLPVLVRPGGRQVASEPPWRSVHVYDHVVEHHHFHVYSPTMLSKPEAMPPQQPALLHHQSEPVLKDMHTRLLEAARALEQQQMLAFAGRAPDEAPSSSSHVELRMEDTQPCEKSSINAAVGRSKCFSSGQVMVLDGAISQEEAAQRRAEAMNAAVSLSQSHAVPVKGQAAASSSMAALGSLSNLQDQLNYKKGLTKADASPNMEALGSISRFKDHLDPKKMLTKGIKGSSASPRSVMEFDFSQPPRVRTLKGNYAVHELRQRLIERAGSVREAFKLLDNNQNGLICITEFLTGLQTLRIDLAEISGAPKATELFHELTQTHSADHDHGVIDVYQLLGVVREADTFDGIGTTELWHKHESGKKSSKNHLDRRAKWSDSDLADGDAQLLRLQAQTKKTNATRMIKQDWQSTRPREELRDTRLLLEDPRLHKKCAREAIHTPVEAVILREADETRKCIHGIKKAMRSCAESRHQVVHMQQLLQPAAAAEESGLGSFAAALHSSIRKNSDDAAKKVHFPAVTAHASDAAGLSPGNLE